MERREGAPLFPRVLREIHVACPVWGMPKGPALVQEVAPLSWDSGTQSRVHNHEGVPDFFVILNGNHGPSKNIVSPLCTNL